MNQICTTIEQSKKLIELGLNPNTADMHIVNQNYGDHGCFEVGLEYHAWDACHVDGYIPCWSVEALLDILSKICNRCEIHLRVDNKWNIFAQAHEGHSNYHSYTGYETVIEACIDVIIWLLENNYIEKIK